MQSREARLASPLTPFGSEKGNSSVACGRNEILFWPRHAWYTQPQVIIMPLTVEEIIAAAAKLPEKDRRRLVQALSAEQTDARSSITELRGLGKEIWRHQDAQEYVDQERDSWAG